MLVALPSLALTFFGDVPCSVSQRHSSAHLPLKVKSLNIWKKHTVYPTASISQRCFTWIHTVTVAGPEGEHHWPKNYPYCGGAFQSPIDIKSELLRFDPTLHPIEVQNYNLSPSEQLTLGNNGHSGEYEIAALSTKHHERYLKYVL